MDGKGRMGVLEVVETCSNKEDDIQVKAGEETYSNKVVETCNSMVAVMMGKVVGETCNSMVEVVMVMVEAETCSNKEMGVKEMVEEGIYSSMVEE